MALTCNTKHPLQYDGTSQHQRFLDALEPGSVKIHEFELRDWMKFSYHVAAHLRYYSIADDKTADGNWQVFMKAEDEIESYLRDAVLAEDEKWIPDEERKKILKREPQSNYEPHLALFLSFLKLLKYPQEQINGLPKRHLDFYYKKVLQLSKQEAVPDRVHVILELAKNATEEILGKNSLLEAGKDKNGKQLRYTTAEEIVVNAAQVASLKSVFHKPGVSIRYAEKTDSSDGLGTEFKEANPQWSAFGNDQWPTANLGFVLASSVLLLKEGIRTITVFLKIEFSGSYTLPSNTLLESYLQVFLTGEKEWIQAPKVTIVQPKQGVDANLSFEVKINAAQKAIVPYNTKLHGEKLNTNQPAMRVLLNTGELEGYNVYAALSNARLIKATIDVNVTGMKDIAIENDNGKLDPSKPFMPFGPLPKQGSNFYVGSAEIFQKEWTEIKLTPVWKNKPSSLVNHYKTYLTKFTDDGSSAYDLTSTSITGIAKVDKEDYFRISKSYIKNNHWFTPDPGTSDLFATPITAQHDPADSGPSTAFYPLLLRKGIDVNKAIVQNYLASASQVQPGASKPPLKFISAHFEVAKFDPGFRVMEIGTDIFSPSVKENYLRLTLQQDFLYEHYGRLMALAMTAKAKGAADVLMPNEPYVPTIASLIVEYSARAENSFSFTGNEDKPQVKLDNFTSRSIQLFHENPFGQGEQHVFLKEQCDFLEPDRKRNISLVPSFSPEGEFYVGLKNAEPSGIVNILFQASEGSEDPLAPTFINNNRIEWYALSNNEWKSLNKDFIVGDSTNNFLRPGILKVTLPREINSSNTVLNDGLFWLKAQLPSGLLSTSVCKMAGVFAQAVEAIFNDNGNELSHLSSSLPAGTIAKFIEKPALLKAVSQPFASFSGRPLEDDRSFYLRVSERLRHKMRAVNIWDYERLVLQKFSSVFKVKCLNHTSTYKEDGSPDYFELSPGYVTLLVIPDIRNKNSFDPLQPRASQNLLREIEDFLVPLVSLHVKFDADNPDYETILLDFRVKFYEQYDANKYIKIINDDLVKYLSPWAFGDFANIHFGGSLYKSVVIRFIEERPYVDFISHFKMYQRKGGDDVNVTDISMARASSARAILSSAKSHSISLIENDKVCDE